jgi:glycosyltransferase involved in cell wall biosynthesis
VTLRVVMLSKALVVGPYQRKAELMATAPDLALTVVVPPLWRDGTWEQRLVRRHTAGYDLVETPIARPGDFHLHFYPRFGQILDDTRPDVVHIDEEPYNLATFLALRAARRRGARTLFFTWQNLVRRYPPPFNVFERYVHRQADGAIAGSQTAADVLRGKGFDGPLWVIPQFGVDPDVFHPADTPRRDGPLRIGFAGRLVRAKGVDLLLDAVAGLAPPWRLTVVGDGPERAPLAERAAALGIADRVSFTGWLNSDDVPAFYRGLDAFVLPSRSAPSWIEQFGRVLIEAMASGVTCVGADSGEIPHVLGDAGLVFPENDAGALRERLHALATEPRRREELAENGRRRVLQHFTMTQVAAETVAAYRALVAQPSTVRLARPTLPTR